MPKKPNKEENIIIKRRVRESVPIKDWSFRLNVDNVERAITTTVTGLANPALIAASPIINPPTTLRI